MKVRHFIIGPTPAQEASEDVLWTICSTTMRCSFHDVYMNDWFVDEKSFETEEDAISYCKKTLGIKRPFVYH